MCSVKRTMWGMGESKVLDTVQEQASHTQARLLLLTSYYSITSHCDSWIVCFRNQFLTRFCVVQRILRNLVKSSFISWFCFCASSAPIFTLDDVCSGWFVRVEFQCQLWCLLCMNGPSFASFSVSPSMGLHQDPGITGVGVRFFHFT